MGLWQRLTLPWRRKGTVEDWFDGYGATARSNSGVYVNQTTAMRATAVMDCVRICSEDVAKLPPRVFRRANGVRKEAIEHPLYRIFRRPNSWQTWFEFCEMMQQALRLRGNGYAVVLRDGRGDPVAMIPVNPDRVMIYEAPGGAVFYSIARMGMHETAMLESEPLMIPAGDVFHLRWAPGINSLLGMSPISYARESIGYALALEMHGANLGGSGARPSGVLQTDKRLTKESAERLAERWRSLHGGVANSGKTAVLEDGVKWAQLTMTSVDMEFIASRKFQLEEICRIFRVSPAKLGVLEGVGRSFEQLQLAHLTDTIHPDLRRWEEKFQAFFELPPDIEVEFDVSQMLRADFKSRADSARVLVMSGVWTPNEARSEFGMNPQDGGDVLLVPANMVPVTMVGQNMLPGPGAGPGSDQSGAPADGGDGDPAQLPTG